MQSRRILALIERWRGLALAVSAAAGLFLLATGAGDGLDEGLKNLRGDWSERPASGSVHIVEIDARSIRALKQWPWPRRFHAAAVDRLREAGARTIAFDVDFSSPSNTVDDAVFAAALGRAGGSVILPTFRQPTYPGAPTFIDSTPIPALAEQSFLAAANVVTEADGELRAMPYGLEIEGAPRPSLAALLVERAGPAGIIFPIDRSIDPKSIPRHSMIDLLRGRVPPDALAGKRVLIGSTAIELGDHYAMPRHGLLPGVVVQALAAETLLAGPPPLQRSGAWPLLAALLIVTVALRARSPGLRRGLAGGAFAFLFMLPLLGPVDVAVAPALGALLGFSLIGGAALFASRYADRVLTDADTQLPNLAALEFDISGRDSAVVAIARIDDYSALLSTLETADAASMLVRIAERLTFLLGERRIYRVDEANLAWVMDSDADLEACFGGIEALMRPIIRADRHVEVRLHFGAAAGAGATARKLAADASLASRQAAARGLRWQFFSARDGEAVSRRIALIGSFDGSLARGELWNMYQPKLDLRSGEITGVEALVRWEHPERGPLSPDSFVDAIEQHGRADRLTLHVMEQALADAIAWRKAGCTIGIAVNLSATLLHDHAFMIRLQERVIASGFPPERVTIEVTESATMADPDAAIHTLQGWRALGSGVSIDDYGTGQSSLSYLQRLPATELKIDKSFIQAMATTPRDSILVKSTLLMAHELGLQVVAEGVEDEATFRLLRDMGCDCVQGYYVSRPAPAAAIPGFAESLRGGKSLCA